MDGPRWSVKSPLTAIAISLVGAAVILAVAAGAQLALNYETSVWENTVERLTSPAKYLGYTGGVFLAMLVGFVAPPVGRLGRGFERKFARWLVSFSAGMAAMVVALGAGLFATKCVPWGLGPEGLASIGLHFLAWGAIIFGAWGSIRAIRG